MDQHVKTVVRRLKSVWRIIGREVTLRLVSAFVTTRLDYCNYVLAGHSQATIYPLQWVQNAVARLVAGIGARDHTTPVLRSLHWLPIRLRILYKLCVLMHPGAYRSQSCLPSRHDDNHRWSYPVVRDSVLPTVSDTKPQIWISSLVSGLSRTLDRRHGTHFHPIWNSRTLIQL